MNNYTTPKSTRREVLQEADIALYLGQQIVSRVVRGSYNWLRSSGGRKTAKLAFAGAAIAVASHVISGIGGPSVTDEQINQAPVKIVTVKPGEGFDEVVEAVNPNLSAQELNQLVTREEQKYVLVPGENVSVPVVSGAGQAGPSTSAAQVKHSRQITSFRIDNR